MKGKTKVKPDFDNGKVKIIVNIDAEGDILENGSKLDLGIPKVLQYIQSLLELDVKNRSQLALNRAQKKYHSDIFRFGNSIYRTYPKAWKEL